MDTRVQVLLGPVKLANSVRVMGADFARYEDDFKTWLATHAPGEKLLSGTGLDRVTWYYYDRAFILYREALRTGNATTMARAHKVALMYRNQMPNFEVPINWSFVRGLGLHALITLDPKTFAGIGKLTNSCRAPYYMNFLDGRPPNVDNTDGIDNRIQGMVLDHYVVSHYIGAPFIANPWEDMRPYKDMAKIALNSILKSQGLTGNFAAKTRQKSPFMTGILHEALILYYRLIEPDPRILPAIMKSADFMWRYWRAIPKAFIYDPGQLDGTPDDLKPAPDLNMLIAPGYGWLYKQTGDVKWKQRGNLILAGSKAAWLEGQKQFNQQYYFGHQYPALV